MTEGLFERIRRSYGQLSDARAKVARFILDRWYDAAFMSAAKLGEAAGVSETVVIRLAELLGYSGWGEVQQELQESIKRYLDIGMVKRLDSKDPCRAEDVFRSWLETESRNLQSVMEPQNLTGAAAAARLILEAHETYVLGLRASYGPAYYLAHNLAQMLGNANFLTLGGDELFDKLRRIKAEDVLVGVTFHRYNAFTYRAAVFAKDRGAKVIAVTDDLASPICAASDAVLFARTDGASYGHTCTAVVSLLGLILELIAQLSRERVRRSLAEVEEVLTVYHPGRRISAPRQDAGAVMEGRTDDDGG